MLSELFRKVFRKSIVRDVTDNEVVDAIRSVPRHYAQANVTVGATRVSKVLNAANQEIVIWCAGQSKVGIAITSVTGTVVLSFEASQDGLTYNPITVGAYPSANPPATGVLTTAATGNYEVPVQNYQFIRVRMSTGAGPVTVVMAASIDGSYQEAFLTSAAGVALAALYGSTTSSAGNNRMTIPAQANRANRLTYLEASMAGPGFGGGAVLRIWDNAVSNGAPLYQCYLTSPVGSVGSSQIINLPTDAEGNRYIDSSPGNALVIDVINLGTTSCNLNARYSLV